MPRVGTDLTGFTVDESGEAVRVEVWGFWGRDVAEQFAPKVVEACRTARVPARLFVDATGLKPQREEGQAAFREMMTASAKCGVQRAVMVVTNAITKLQLVRIAAENGAGAWTFVTSHASALAVLAAPQSKVRS